MFALEPITPKNIADYEKFEQCFQTSLYKTMSRYLPHNAEHYEKRLDDGCLRWFYIEKEGRKIESVWLEKEHPNDTSALLGIFICEEDERCRGIGKWAIKELIKRCGFEMNLGRIILHVRGYNAPAIRCYEKCGFRKTDRGIEPSGFEGLVMEKNL